MSRWTRACERAWLPMLLFNNSMVLRVFVYYFSFNQKLNILLRWNMFFGCASHSFVHSIGLAYDL